MLQSMCSTSASLSWVKAHSGLAGAPLRPQDATSVPLGGTGSHARPTIPRPMTSRFPTRVVLAVAVVLVLWASAYAGIRAGLKAYSPPQLALLRFLVASAVLAVYAAIAHFRRPEWRDIPGLILTGAIGITFYNIAL